MTTPFTLALIVAAGRGERLKSDIPKAYVEFGGMPLLRHSLLAFTRHPLISAVRVVTGAGHEAFYEEAARGLTLLPPATGGATRQESVRLGLEGLAKQPDYVLIHDAARPFVSEELITRIAKALRDAPAAIPALAVNDTVKQLSGTQITATLPRETLALAQTPQGFHYAPILEAHRRFAAEAATDDAAIAEMAGMKVQCVEGEAANRKITTREDLMQHYETRTGMGADVHPFRPHEPDAPPMLRHIALGGIKIPHDMAVAGHSDADCALHAAVDALLGTIGQGDIGQHFPPENPKWAGADSTRFLLHAYELIRERGGEIVNLDITILCERPKIAPFRKKMQETIADTLKLSHDRVNIKATTTEKLGFLGRGEGIAAQAVATVRLPRSAA